MIDQEFLKEFVFESNKIDPQPGHENVSGDARFDDHLKAAKMAVKFAEEGSLAPADLVHETIMRNLKGMRKHAGVYRKVSVYVGGRTCPPSDKISRLMEHWKQMVVTEIGRAKESSDEGKKQLVWDLHVAYEYIHPWFDGNGRSGRILLLNHALILGLKPWVIRYDDREEYYRRFECREHTSWQVYLNQSWKNKISK